MEGCWRAPGTSLLALGLIWQLNPLLWLLDHGGGRRVKVFLRGQGDWFAVLAHPLALDLPADHVLVAPIGPL